METKTWTDIENAARGSLWTDQPPKGFVEIAFPPLRQALAMVELGEWTREQALIQVTLALLQVRQQDFQRRVDEMNSRPFRPLLLPKD